VISRLVYQNEAAARTWIDAFFFRVSAMVPSDERVVLTMEQHIPPTAVGPSSTTTLHGIVDYTAAIVDESVVGGIFVWLVRFLLARLTPQ